MSGACPRRHVYEVAIGKKSMDRIAQHDMAHNHACTNLSVSQAAAVYKALHSIKHTTVQHTTHSRPHPVPVLLERDRVTGPVLIARELVQQIHSPFLGCLASVASHLQSDAGDAFQVGSAIPSRSILPRHSRLIHEALARQTQLFGDAHADMHWGTSPLAWVGVGQAHACGAILYM